MVHKKLVTGSRMVPHMWMGKGVGDKCTRALILGAWASTLNGYAKFAKPWYSPQHWV
jgi:hypothetical protein